MNETRAISASQKIEGTQGCGKYFSPVGVSMVVRKDEVDSMSSGYKWASSRFPIRLLLSFGHLFPTGLLLSLRHLFPKAFWRVVSDKCMKFAVRQSRVQVLPYEFCDAGKVLKVSKSQLPHL